MTILLIKVKILKMKNFQINVFCVVKYLEPLLKIAINKIHIKFVIAKTDKLYNKIFNKYKFQIGKFLINFKAKEIHKIHFEKYKLFIYKLKIINVL